MKIIFALCLIVGLSLGLQAHSILPTYVQPHKKDCYTQGLFFLNETHLFQSCGLYNESYYHILEYSSDPFKITETFRSQLPWKPNIFFEGATIFKDYIYVMTWQEHVVYKLKPDNFQLVDELMWSSQGWGLTNNGTHMFVTDGSDKVYVVDEDFQILQQKSIQTASGRKAYNLNELEYHNGYLYANIYYDRFIHKIDYERGKIDDSYDGLSLIQNEKKNNYLKPDEVFNGIAYSEKTRKFIVTGKHWSTMY